MIFDATDLLYGNSMKELIFNFWNNFLKLIINLIVIFFIFEDNINQSQLKYETQITENKTVIDFPSQMKYNAEGYFVV